MIYEERFRKIIKKGGVKEIYYTDFDENDKPIGEFLIYKIFSRKNKIYFYSRNENFKKEIIFDGFLELPIKDRVFSKTGYVLSPVSTYLSYRLNKYSGGIKNIIISKNGKSSFLRKKLILNYQDLVNLKKDLDAIYWDARLKRASATDSFLFEINNKKFTKPKETSSSRKVTYLRLGIDEKIIKELPKDLVFNILDFSSSIIEKRYEIKSKKKELLERIKIKVNEISLKELVDKFEDLLKNKTGENDWSKFLRDNLFLVDPKYIHYFPEMSVTLGAKNRKVDFGILDIYGYLDIFEIKRPNTQLLAKKEDRGNYYWSTEAIKAITQAEKYRYNAELKSRHLEDDTERETGKKVKVIKPRTILLIGNSKQLDSKAKKEDFKILRDSLKNVEVVLYDELLDKIKIQSKHSIYK